MTERDFSAPWFLGNPHLQTFGAAAPLHLKPPAGARETLLRVPIPEGGVLHAVAWFRAGPARCCVLLVHGVGGSSDSRYLVRAAKAFFAEGWNVVRLNLRGAGDSMWEAHQLYHAGLCADLHLACAALSARPEVAWLSVVGFSLGGNCALRFSAEASQGADARVRAVVSVSAPLDLSAVSTLFERTKNLPYRFYILGALVRRARAFARAHPDRVRYEAAKLLRVRTMRGFDDLVIAPMHGFDGAEDYYAKASSGQVLPSLRVPTLLVHAEDDPLVPGETVRPFLRHANGNLEVAWSRRGGHVGWLTGLDEQAWLRTWAVERAMRFLEGFSR